MYKILDHVRKDAIRKCKPTGEEDHKILVDAAVSILELTILAHDEGLLALEEKVAKKTADDFLRRLIMLVVDGTDPQLVVEIGSNRYWAKNPRGFGLWSSIFIYGEPIVFNLAIGSWRAEVFAPCCQRVTIHSLTGKLP